MSYCLPPWLEKRVVDGVVSGVRPGAGRAAPQRPPSRPIVTRTMRGTCGQEAGRGESIRQPEGGAETGDRA